MKRLGIFTVILLLTVSVISANQQKAVVLSFTPAGECFIGFSRKSVTSTVKLKETEKYSEGAVIPFNFDEVNGYYHTDIFYAYCQSFTDKPVTIKLSTPVKISNVTTGTDATFDYELLAPGAIAGTSGTWSNDGANYYIEVTETQASYNKPRVVLNQPIQIKFPATTDVKPKTKYTLKFTLEIISA